MQNWSQEGVEPNFPSQNSCFRYVIFIKIVSFQASTCKCFEEAYCEAYSFEDVSFEASSFETASFEALSFENASFEASSFEVAAFEASSFESASFEVSSFENASFEASSFGVDSFEASSFETASFEVSSFEVASFEALPNIRPGHQGGFVFEWITVPLSNDTAAISFPLPPKRMKIRGYGFVRKRGPGRNPKSSILGGCTGRIGP